MNRSLKKLKEAYLSVKPTENFEERLKIMIKRKKTYRKLAQTVAAAAAVFAVFVGSLNLLPTFAKEVAALPGMDSLVKVLTLGRYHVKDNNFYADIVTPQLEGLLDPQLQDKLNQDFRENADMVIAAFEKSYQELKQADPDAHLGVECNYQVRTDTPDILAIDVYWLETVGSSSTTHRFYTIDKNTGELLTLSSLFQEGADYITPISDYILNEMRRQNQTGERYFWTEDSAFADPFRAIRADQNFYLNENGKLVVCFDKYEAGPGSSGSPEFVIPDQVVASILK